MRPRFWLPLILVIFSFSLTVSAQDNPVFNNIPAFVLGHGRIRDLILSPDGEQVVVNTSTGLYLAEVGLPQIARRLNGHTDTVTGMAFTPDGQILASGGFDGTLRLWSMPDGTPLATIDLPGQMPYSVPRSFIFEESGQRAFITTGTQAPGPALLLDIPARTLTLLDTGFPPAVGVWNGELISARSEGEGITVFTPEDILFTVNVPEIGRKESIGFSSNAVYIVADNNVLHAFDQTGQSVLQLPEVTFAFTTSSPDVIKADRIGGGLTLVNLKSGASLDIPPQEFSILIAYSEGDYLVYKDVENHVRVVDLKNLTEISLDNVNATYESNPAIFHYGDNILIWTSNPARYDIWNVERGQYIAGAVYAEGAVALPISSPDGRYLVFKRDKGLLVVDIESGTVVFESEPDFGITPLTFSNSTLFYAAGNRVLWHNMEAETDGEIALPGHNGESRSLAYSADGLLLASGGTDNTVRLWNTADGTEARVIRLEGEVTFEGPLPLFAPDGQLLIAWDNIVRIYDPATGSSTGRIIIGDHIHDFALSADGESIAVATRSGLLAGRLSELVTGAALTRLSDEHWRAVAYDPTGRYIAAGRLNNTDSTAIRLWDAASGEVVRSLEYEPMGAIVDLAFSADGTQIAAAGYGLNVWQVETGEVMYNMLPGMGLVGGGESGISFGGGYLASAEQQYGFSGYIALRDVESGDMLAILKRRVTETGGGGGSGVFYQPVAFSPDGAQLASTDPGGAVVVWDVPSGLVTGGAGANIIAYCDDLPGSPARPSPNMPINIIWSWYATEITLISDHVRAANYTIRLDGQPLPVYEVLRGVVRRDPANNNNWTIYYSLPVGTLAAGTHTIEYEVTWREAINDGIETFGPGTLNESQSGTCTFEVG